MAPLIFDTKSGLKGFPGAIFKNKITRSSPSELYWGTHRLSDTSSKASTTDGREEGREEGRVEDNETKQKTQRAWEENRAEETQGEGQREGWAKK